MDSALAILPATEEATEKFQQLFRQGEIDITPNEQPYSVLVDRMGNIHGGVVISYGYAENDGWQTPQKEITFSIAIKPAIRRSGWGKKLVQHLVDNNQRHVIKAQVVNPHMVPLLRDLGFVKEDEHNDYDQTFLKIPNIRRR